MEKQYDLSKFSEIIDMNIDFNDKCSNFFYTLDDNLSAEKQTNIKNSLDYYINYAWPDKKVTFLNIDQIPHELNYHEKQDFFKESYLHVIDCLSVNTDNFHKVALLYDCSKDLKTAFLYVNTPETLRNYVMNSQQYILRTHSFGDIDNDFLTFKNYNELMNKIEDKPINNNIKKKI